MAQEYYPNVAGYDGRPDLGGSRQWEAWRGLKVIAHAPGDEWGAKDDAI